MNRDRPLKTINHLAQGGGQFAPPLCGCLQAERAIKFFLAAGPTLTRHKTSAIKFGLIPSRLVLTGATNKKDLIVGRRIENSAWKKGGTDAS